MKNVKIELAIAGLFLGLLVLFLVWQHDGADKPEPDTLRQVAVIPGDVKELAILTITEDLLVKDAAIVQRGRVISLALVVNAATTKEHARTLGYRFVRLVKGLAPDETPPLTSPPNPGPEAGLSKLPSDPGKQVMIHDTQTIHGRTDHPDAA